MRRMLICAALALFAVLCGTIATASAHYGPGSSTVEVTEEDVNPSGDWSSADTRPDGTGTFEAGPATAPAGDGSFELRTNAPSAKVQLLTDRYDGTRLADVTALGYSTYRDAASTGFVAALPALNLRADLDNDGTTDAYVVYEPYQDQGNAAVQTGVWQTWDAYDGGNAKWWINTGAGGCGQATPCAWSAIVAAFPNAKIREGANFRGSFGVNQGSGNPGTIANADKLVIGVKHRTTTFDFEPLAGAPGWHDACSSSHGWSWWWWLKGHQRRDRCDLDRVTEEDVNPSRDWSYADTRPDGTGTFEYGPAPLGKGSFELRTPSNPAKVQLLTDVFDGTKLGKVTGIGYSTYRDAESTGFVAGVAALNIRADLDGDAVTDSYLVYEPYQDRGNDAVQTGVWQHWDAYRDGQAKWWINNGAGGCGQATPCTWSKIVSLFPNGAIEEGTNFRGSFGANQGSFNSGIVSNVDALYLSVEGDRRAFDLEPLSKPTWFDDCDDRHKYGHWRFKGKGRSKHRADDCDHVRVDAGDVKAYGSAEWSYADTRAPGKGSFEYGPAWAPLGKGSFELRTPDNTAKVQLLTRRFDNTPLADVSGMGYSTYRDASSTGFVAGLPALNIRADLDGNGTSDAYLVYEPYQDRGNAAVETGEWQHWDTYRDGLARWWINTGAGGCGQATPCTWRQILAAFPNAKVREAANFRGSFGLNQGSFNAGIVANADALYLSLEGDRTAFDFER